MQMWIFSCKITTWFIMKFTFEILKYSHTHTPRKKEEVLWQSQIIWCQSAICCALWFLMIKVKTSVGSKNRELQQSISLQ